MEISMGLVDNSKKLFRRVVLYSETLKEKHRRRHRVVQRLWERSAETSVDFIEKNMANAVVFDNREDLWIKGLQAAPAKGLILEFGVFEGVSINFFADYLARKNDSRRLYGFDSFEGLEEDWSGEALPAGYFNQGGKLPPVRNSVQLIKGWVQDTFPPFLKEHGQEGIAFIHIDTDTYSPARCILEHAAPYLLPGAVISYDELIGYPNWQNHEYKALNETIPQTDYEFIAFTSRQASMQMKTVRGSGKKA
jgi:hypothetical protein